jgi:phage gp29-like protein
MNQPLLNNVNSWRTQFNPLRSLTIARAVSILEEGMLGQYANLMWLYEYIEQTDADLLALVERRLSAIAELDWNIKTVPEEFAGYNQTLAENQTNELRSTYDKINNLGEAIEFLELAAFRGFSILQPHYDKTKTLIHLEPLDHWNWVRDGRYGKWAWNPMANAINFASVADNAIDETQFIIRQCHRPIDRIGLIKFMRANGAEKDWDAYVEIYGIPAAFVIGPADVPTGKETEYKDAAEDAARGNGGYLPNGSDVKFANEARGNQPFKMRLDHLSEKLILAGTGGMLTMLTQSGSGTLAGNAHADTFQAIAQAEARRISEILQKFIDTKILEEKFPGKPRLAYFEMASEETPDLTVICNHFQTLSAAGLQIDPEDAMERTGYKLTAKQIAPPAFPQTFNRESRIQNPESEIPKSQISNPQISNSLDQKFSAIFAQAVSDDLKPIRDRIETALANEDNQAMLDSLNAIPAELPAMLLQITRKPNAEPILQDAITAGILEGIAEKQTTQKEPAK